MGEVRLIGVHCKFYPESCGVFKHSPVTLEKTRCDSCPFWFSREKSDFGENRSNPKRKVAAQPSIFSLHCLYIIQYIFVNTFHCHGMSDWCTLHFWWSLSRWSCSLWFTFHAESQHGKPGFFSQRVTWGRSCLVTKYREVFVYDDIQWLGSMGYNPNIPHL